MAHKITIFVPYGRVVEFRKWSQANPHIVSHVKKGQWEGSYGSSYHARTHHVTVTEEHYLSLLKLSWNA